MTYFKTIIAFRGSGSLGSWKEVLFGTFAFKSFAKLLHGHVIVHTCDVRVLFTSLFSTYTVPIITYLHS